MFYFRRRTNATSYDPYDCLTTSHLPAAPPHHQFESDDNNDEESSQQQQQQQQQQFFNQDEYWSNGSTVQFFNISSEHNNNNNNNNSVSSTILHSASNMMKAIPDPAATTNNHVRNHYDNNQRNTGNNIQISTETRKRSNNYEVRNSIVAGSLAGITSCSIFHPFDVIRTKMQASTKIISSSSTTTAATTLTSNSGRGSVAKAAMLRNGINSSSGPLAVISHTYKNGGIRAFYTGITLPLAAQALYKSTVFTTNRISVNFVTEWRTKEKRKTGIFTKYQLTPFDHFVCGSISGAVNALLFVCPVEYVRNQLIQQHTKNAEGRLSSNSAATMKGPIDVIRKTLRTEGVFGLWRGASVTLVRDSIGCGAFFIMNDLGHKYISRTTGYNEDSLVNKIGSGFLAGFGYWFVSLPVDALKTLVQTGKASSAMDTFSLLVKRDGIISATRQLYRGWQLAFGRGSPSAAITLSTYSLAYNFCERNCS